MGGMGRRGKKADRAHGPDRLDWHAGPAANSQQPATHLPIWPILPIPPL